MGLFRPAPSSGTRPNEIFSILILRQLRYEGSLLIISLSVFVFTQIRNMFSDNNLKLEQGICLILPNRIT